VDHYNAISWHINLLDFFAASPPEDNILDTLVVSRMVSNLCDMRATEALPLIRKLYDQERVCKFQVGSCEELAQEILKPVSAPKQRQPQSLIDYFRSMSTWQAKPSTPAKPEILRGGIETLMTRPVTQPRGEEILTGRNDPCPCGSGRKFKKCCMK